MIKPIEDFEGYFISDDGKVYSNLGRGNRRIGKTVEMYEISPRLARNGYLRIYCRQTSTGKRKDLYIHRLVAKHFIPNLDNKEQVNHKNCIRSDNRVENLEWCTSKENNEYTLKVEYMKRNKVNGRFVSGF